MSVKSIKLESLEGNILMPTPEDLELRLRQDENAWCKVQEQANRQHADSLNQLADVYKLVRKNYEEIQELKSFIKKLMKEKE